MEIALLGNPNVGKTTLFNLLTGSRQYVGNWPGVTVEKKEGYHNDIKVVDLPGIYALDTYSNEEKVSKSYLESGKADFIVNIVDASNLVRNLYLTSQATRYGIPMIIVLNMTDVADTKGLKTDPHVLQEELGIKVIPLVASSGKNINELIVSLMNMDTETAYHPKIKDFESEEEAYKKLEEIAEKATTRSEIRKSISEKIDTVVLNPLIAYPLFLAVLFLVFKLTFSWIGDPLSGAFEDYVIVPLSHFITSLLSGSSGWFRSLVSDGIIAGVGSVIVFLPVIMVMFFSISLLEESGYMARAALIMDRLMRKMGLSGKAFIPMIIGFGCSVPAIMSARTLETEKDRRTAALLAPLMSCNARLPVYLLFAGIFFKGHEEIVVMSLYILGVVIAFLIGILFKNTIFRKDEEPFIIELPDYHVPNLKSVFSSTWDKAKGFLKKAGTLIFSLSVIVWFLSNFNLNGMSEMQDSFLASAGKVIAPLLKPLGFGNWQSAVALTAGLMAKEVVVSTLEIVFTGNLQGGLAAAFTPVSAYAFLVFVLLYTPCVAVIAAFKKEYGTKMMLFSVSYQMVLAWVVSFIFYNVGSLIWR